MIVARDAGRRSITFVVNGGAGSSAATRAERIARALRPHSTEILLRESSRRTVVGLARQARRIPADLIYCVDLAFVPLAVACVARPMTPMIVDTGDYPSAFFRQVRAGQGRILLARLMEEVAYRRAAGMVVRGPHHAAILRGHGVSNIRVIPDGVDLTMVEPVDVSDLRRRLGLSDVMTIGIAGAFTWFPAAGGGLGWELVQTLARVRDKPVHGVLIGGGPGLVHLRQLAHDLGVSERLHILGHVPYSDYARYVSLIDVCLLTQTNDPSSWVRTTGKLPGYLALDRYVLASAVGTATEVLPPEMLVEYHGSWDPTYPDRLAAKVSELLEHPRRLATGAGVQPLVAPYSYDTVAGQAAAFILELLERADR